MMRNWRIAIPPLLLALVMAGYSGYQAWGVKVHARRLAVYVQECRTKAEQGNPEFEAELGGLYGRGRGLPRDDAAALQWYRKAADQGFAGGEAGLGYYFFYGIGVPQSDAESFRWYQLAANQGDANAQDALGVAYFRGKGVSQDDVVAVRWFRKAADQGYPAAEYDLGWMERYGRGTPRDSRAALALYRRAAAAGDPDAQRAVTRPFSALTKYTLLICLLFSLWLISEFFFDLPRLARSTPKLRRHSIVILVCASLSTAFWGMTWYGYVHHKILCIGCGMNGFTVCRWTLDILLLVLAFGILRPPKKAPAEPTQEAAAIP
jgi:hypothetical protein